MSRTCSICNHLERDPIERDLIAGQPYRDIAGRFEVSKSALERHVSSGHIAAAIARAADASEVIRAGQLVQEVRTLRETTLGILEESRHAGDHAAALGAVRSLLQQAELCGRLAGELVERHEVTARALVLDAEWVRLRGLVVSALAPFPDALLAVAAALGAGDESAA